METKTVIETEELTKIYNTQVAVDHLSFSIKQGEIFGFLGPNGAGKTTTLLMLLGLTEPSSGKVRVMDLEPIRNPIEVKRMIGYLPENMGFYRDLNARQMLKFVADLNRLPMAVAGERIEDALKEVGLTEETDKKIGVYSRGMRQRLGIAELLINGGPGPDGSSGRGEAWDWGKRVYTGRGLHEVLYGGITLYGVKVILKKELSDHFSSYRFIILFALIAMVSLITVYMVGLNIKQDLEGVAKPKYIFLMLFTSSGAGFSLVDFVGFFGPLIGMILGFDTINRERSEGTLSKLLSQPIYRDTVLNGKFLAGVCVIAVMMVSIVLIITGLGLSMVGVIPGIEEVWRRVPMQWQGR
jgi:ABC-type transport system involved in cytochrome c biogenesis ATPase subunit